MFWTAGPALGISLVIFFVLGLNADPDAAISTDAARAALGDGVQHLRAQPAAAAAAGGVRGPASSRRSCRSSGSALFAGVLAPFLQWDAVKAFVDDPSLGPVATGDQGHLRRDGHRLRQQLRRRPQIDDLFSRGGMASLLTTIWLVLGALSFAAVMEHAGFLQRLLEPIVSRDPAPRLADRSRSTAAASA